MEGKFSPKYFIAGGGPEAWFKALGYGWRICLTIVLVGLLIAGGMNVWHFIFPAPDKQMNKPKVYALPGSKIGMIDQSNVQIQMSEKPWAVTLGAGVFNWDGKAGGIIGGVVTRKW